MKRQVYTISLILILALSVQVSLIVESFPGFGGQADCRRCHNEPATSYNESTLDSEIIMDGDMTEAFWSETYGRRMMIPVASSFGGVHEFITVIFAQNATHLFFHAHWDDATVNGTDDDAYDDSDGFALMFNINATDFTAENFGGMATKNVGEAVDVYIWKPAASETNVHNLETDPKARKTLDSHTYDYSVNSDGWQKEEEQNGEYAVMHGNVTRRVEHHYSLEFARPLMTDDVNDVQFEYNGYYSFAIAVFNATSGSDHYVSFPHMVYVHNLEVPPIITTETVTEPANFASFFVVSMITLLAIVVVPRVNRFDK